jgi:hypothetical protein
VSALVAVLNDFTAGSEWRKSTAPKTLTQVGPEDVEDVLIQCRVWFVDVKDFSGLAEVGKHWVDEFEGLVNFLADLGSGKHDFAADENEQNDFRLHHAVNLKFGKSAPACSASHAG